MTQGSGALPGAPGSPLAERSNLLNASPDDGDKARRPQMLSPLARAPPALQDGGASPRTPLPQLEPEPAGSAARPTPARSSGRSSLAKQPTAAWARSPPALTGGMHAHLHGARVPGGGARAPGGIRIYTYT